MSPEEKARELMTGLLPAGRGYGPLLQRDYWAVIRRCRLKPSELVALVARKFPELAPEEVVVFEPSKGSGAPLALGDELNVRIRGAGTYRVRVVHQEAASFTLATLEGHPEAGRITFGAYRNRVGDVIFHIRSRARSGSRTKYAGFLAVGDAMQTQTWADLILRVAHTAGEGVLGVIHADKRKIHDEPQLPEVVCGPTYLARAD